MASTSLSSQTLGYYLVDMEVVRQKYFDVTMFVFPDVWATVILVRDKIQRLRIELDCYNFDIKYFLGRCNVTADTLSRTYCSAVSFVILEKLRNSLFHHGNKWMMYLFYLVEERCKDSICLSHCRCRR